MDNLITPGEWVFKEQGDSNEFCIITTDNQWVAAFRLNGIQTVERQRANGKIMTASKEMLKALEHIINIPEADGIKGCTWGDTDLDSVSVAHGYNQCLEYLQEIAARAVLKATV